MVYFAGNKHTLLALQKMDSVHCSSSACADVRAKDRKVGPFSFPLRAIQSLSVLHVDAKRTQICIDLAAACVRSLYLTLGSPLRR